MFLQRYYLECLSHASYMVADERTGEATVIDPQRDIGIYLEEAEQRGFKIRHVVLTHFHADFIAGHIELREKILRRTMQDGAQWEISSAQAYTNFVNVIAKGAARTKKTINR